MKRPDKYYKTFTKKDLIEYIDYVEDFANNMAAIKHEEINELKKQVENLNIGSVSGSDTIKTKIEAYKECFQMFIPIDKWDEATEFLSTYGSGLAKVLLNKGI